MSDNTTQIGNATIAADDVTTLNGGASSGVLVQRTKVTFGDDGTARDVSAAFPLPVSSSPSATGTLSSVTASATSVTILASNANRKGALIYNDSTSTLALAFGATASLTAFTLELPAQAFYEMPMPNYTGVISGIWASATGAARVTELT